MSNTEGGVKNEKDLKAYIDVVRRDVWHLLLQMLGEANKPSDNELSVFLLELTKILNQFWRFALPIVRPKQHVMFPDAAETIGKNEGLPMLHERFPGLKTLSSCYPWPLEKPNVFPTPVPIGLAGWLAAEVKSTLTAFSASKQPAVWLELGTWMGMSARAMLDVAPAERGLKLHVNGSAWWVDPLVRMEAAK